jgi:phospholipase/carboxylesterase
MNRLQFGPLAMMDAAETEANDTGSKDTGANGTGKLGEGAVKVGDLGVMANAGAVGAGVLQTGTAGRDGVAGAVRQRLFIPAGYEKNYAYPLLVYLHDREQTAGQLHRIMPEFSLQNYVGTAFQSPILGPEKRGPAILGRARGGERAGAVWEQHDRGLAAALDGLADCIAMAQSRLNINREKIFLVGSGAGGSMALRLAFLYPQRIAGVVSLNGELPAAGPVLSRLKVARNIPILMSHFRDSSSFTEHRLCENLVLLHSAGFSVTMRQYPCDDGGCGQVYRDANAWIMETVTGG